MPSSFYQNGFHVLGLSNSAEMKEILRRSNEISQLFELDEISEFDTDIIPASQFRTADAVRDSLRRLQNPRQRFEDYFFWIDFRSFGEPLASALKLDGWNGVAKALVARQSAETFLDRRQLLVSQTIALRSDPEGAADIFRSWKKLITDGAFWADLQRIYAFDGQLAASDELISTFRSSVAASLGDLIFELASSDSSSAVVQQFTETFGTTSDGLKEALLSPALKELKAKAVALSSICVDEGVQVTSELLKQIRGTLEGVESALNSLIDSGLYEESEVKLARDNTALEIRRLVLDCHNHHSEFSVAHGLLKIAHSIAGTGALKTQLSGELSRVADAVAGQQDDTVTIDVPGTFGGGTMILENESVAYNGVSIKYRDAATLSYSSTTRSVNFIPTSQSYSLSLTSLNGQSISINFGTTLYIGNAAKQSAWARMAGILDQVAGPHIVRRLVKKIFDEGGEYNIGGVVFNRHGYSKKRTFAGFDVVAWDSDTYIPKFSEGNVIIWTSKDGNAVQLAAVPMSTPNAVVLPELIKACVARVLGNV